MTTIIVIVTVLLVVMVIGHLMWLAMAGLFRVITGQTSADTAAGTVTANASKASGAAGQGDQAVRRDLLGYKNTVDRLGEQGRIEAVERDHLHALGRAFGQQLFAGVPAAPTPAAASTVRSTPAKVAVEPIDGDVSETYQGGVHPLDQPDEPPVVMATVADTAAAPQAAQPIARRAMSEVLSSFLVAHNIRWGELIAGLLIVFCSVGLVISLWNPLTETHRLLPSLVFLGGTIAIEAAGLYTLRRWRLRHTSRAVLTIATLLIPLSVVAGIAVAGTGEDAVRLSDPAALGFIAIGSTLYLGAIWLAGCALVRRHDAVWWLMVIAVPTLSLPLVPAVVRHWGIEGGWLVAAAAVLVSAAVLVPSGRRRARLAVAGSGSASTGSCMVGASSRPAVRSVAGRHQLMIAAVGVYAIAVLIGFLTFHYQATLASVVPLAISILPLLVTLAGVGSVLRGSQVSWQRLTGTTLVAFSSITVFALFPIAVARPTWLLLWGLFVVAAAIAVAMRLRSQTMIGLAAMALGTVTLMIAPWWFGGSLWDGSLFDRSTWGQTPWGGAAEIWRRPVSGAAMLIAFAYGLVLLTGSVALPKRLRLKSSHGTSSGLGISIAAAAWLSYAVLVAVISGCFGWLFAPPTPWRAATGVIAATGLLSIAVAILIKRDRHRFAPVLHRFRFPLLWIGQCGVLLAGAIALGWSVPQRVWGVDAWLDGNASWWWIGLVGGFAAVWQIPRWLSPKRFPANLVVRRNWLTVDVACGLVAAIAVMICSAMVTMRLVVHYGTAQSIPFAAWNVPLVALALIAFWLLAYRSRTAALRAVLTDTRVLAAHAAVVWVSIRLFAGRPYDLVWIGSIEWLATLGSLLIAWRFVRMWGGNAGALASRSAGWGGAVVIAMSGTLLYHHLLRSFIDTTAINPTAVWAVIGWMALAILALSIASVVSSRRSYGLAAAGLVPLAAASAAAIYTPDRWIWLETIGWTSLIVVLCQRLCEPLGILRWLRATTPDAAPTSNVASVGNAASVGNVASVGDVAVDRQKPWPVAVTGLSVLATAIACLFAVVCLPLVWSTPLKAAALATPSFVGFIAAALVTARFLPATRWTTSLGLTNIAAVLCGPAIALAIRFGGLPPGDGRLWLLGIVALLAVADGVISALRPDNRMAWASGMLKASAVVLLGFASRIWGENFVLISIAGSLVIQGLSMVVTNRIAATGQADRQLTAQLQARHWLGQGLWCVSLLASVALWMSIGWSGPDGDLFTTTMIMGWLTAVTVLARVGQLRMRPGYPCVGEGLALTGSLLAMLLIVAQRIDSVTLPSTLPIISGSVVLAAMLLLATTAIRMGQRMQVLAAMFAGLLATGLVALDVADRFQVPSAVAVAAAAIAVMTTLATWLWPLRRAVRRGLIPYGLHWSRSDDRRGTAELTFGVLAVTTAMLMAAMYVVIDASLPTTRYLLIASVMLTGWATANVAGRRDSIALRTVAVLVFAMAILLTAVAAPQLGELRLLVTTMRMLVAACCLVPIFGYLVPRTFGLNNDQWQRPLQIGAGVGLAVAGVSLVAMFVLEVMARVSGQIESLDKPLVIGIAVLLAAMCAAATWLAVRPRDGSGAGVLPRLQDRERVVVIYLAQVLGFITWLHLYLCRSYLALLGLRPYWPYTVMVLAFVSVAIVEWARRRGDKVLADTLRQSSLLLPLIPAIGFWFSGSQMGWLFIGGRVDYAVALAVGGFYYIGLCFVWRSDRWPRVLGVVLGNAALWVTLVQQPGWEFLKHPQLWLIPPAVCVLLAAHLDRERLRPQVLSAIRYAAMLVIYVSSTADMLIQQIGETIWGPILLLTLALAGVAVGMLLRVRSFLYVGTLFVLVGVLSMVWHAQAAMDEVWPWWAFGITSGILILAGLTMIEKKKPQIRRLSQRLASWQG